MTLFGGGANASASITGDGSGQLTIVPQFGDSLVQLTGDGLGNMGVSLGSIAHTLVDANSQGVLFRGTSTAAEADYTPVGSDQALVAFPGADTQFDVHGLGGNPIAFDEFGAGNLFKVIGTSDPNAFNVSQPDANTVVAVTDLTTGFSLLPASIVSTDTGSLFVQGGNGNDALTVDSTAAAVAIPITYDGGAGQNTLTLSGGTATSDTYAPGPAAGSGTSQITIGGATQTVNFLNLAPVLDTVPGPLTVTGTNGNDAITYAAPTNSADQGLVSVNDQETIEFANKTGLTINTQNGTDAVSINNPTAQTGLTGITVNGGDPSAGDTLTVSGTSGDDTVNYSPTGVGAGTVAVATLPTVTFAGIGSVAYNGGGGNDNLTVTTPVTVNGTSITFFPGATANQGSVALREESNNGTGAVLLTPLSYTQIDREGTLIFANAGATREDTLTFNGRGSGDSINIGANATGDGIGLVSSGGFGAALNVTASGVSALIVQGVGSNDAFTVFAPLAFNVAGNLASGVTLFGGGAGASIAVAGDGSGQLTIVPQFGDSLPQMTGDGLGNSGVSFGNIATVFVSANSQAVLFRGTGTAGETDYTPVGSDEGLVAFPGADTQFDVTGLGTNPLVFDALGPGSGSVFKVIGSSDPNAFNVSQAGANTVVAVSDLTTGIDLLAANIVSTDTGSLVVQGGNGNDALTVDSTAAAVAIPITYDGGAGQNALSLSGGTATSDTYAPGPAAGSGTSQITLGGVTQTVNFRNLAPVFDTVSGPLTVSGTNGNDAIAYRAPANPANQGLVSVNDQETIEFANKTSLTINTQNGTDAVSINNPSAQAGLGGITVTGGDPAAGDTLTVSGTAGNDTVDYSPTAAGAGTVAIATLPTVTFAGIGSVAYNGGGGNDALTVTTPISSPATDITFTPGATVNQGTVSLRQGSTSGTGGTLLTPLSYTNIDRNGSLIFATADGTRHDTLTYNGVGSGDTFTIGGNATDDQVLLGRSGGFAGALDVTASSVSALVVQGVGSNDAFLVTAPLAFSVPEILNSGVTLLGGGPDASVAITGDGSGQLTIVPQLGDSLPLLTGDGLGNKGVSLGSIAYTSVNANQEGVLFQGTSTADEDDYTPIGSDEGLVEFPGADTQYDVNGLGGNPLLFDEFGSGNLFKVIGTPDDNAFNVSQAGANTIVAVSDLTLGFDLLPANIVSTDTSSLFLQGRSGNDALTVDSTTAAVAIPITFDGGTGSNSLTLSGGTATSDTYAPGPAAGSGTSQITIGGATQTVNFLNLAPVLDTVAGPLTVSGNGANNVINYTVGSSTANGLVAVDDFEPIEFSNKTALTLDGMGGDDTIIVNNPNTPTGLTALAADGGTGNDTLIVNANNQAVVSTDITAATVTIPGALPAFGLGYTSFEQVQVLNAQDSLTGTSVPTLAATQAVPLAGALVASFSFSDPLPPSIFASAGDFVASINWGDGSITTAGTIVADGTTGFQVFGSHTYLAAGSNTVKVTVTDAGSTRRFTPAGGVAVTIDDNSGATTTPTPIAVAASVASAPLSSQGTVINAVEATPVTATVATFTDANPNAALSDFTTPPGGVTIDWGDSSPLDTTSALVTLIGTTPNGAIFSVQGTHDYIEEGTYPVTVTIKDVGGSTTVATSNAVVADSPPTANPVQPIIMATEGVAFVGPVAGFSEIYVDPTTGRTNAEPLSNFTGLSPMIDWGDGTPPSLGSVVSDPAFPANSGHYLVVGEHIYADSGANIGAGVPSKNFTVTVNIHDGGGANLAITNVATVSDVAINLTAQLNPASDSGKFANDAITNVNQPNFFGTSEPFSNINLFATPTGGGATVLIGQTEAGSDGSWNITSNRLADGSYRITATAVDQSGATTAGPIQVLPTASEGALIIDTVGPRIVNVQFDRLTGGISVTFQDDRSGMLTQSLLDAANYSFNRQPPQQPGKFIVTNLTLSGGGSPTGPQTLAIQINGGRQIKGGSFGFTVYAESVLKASGVQDLAGNALDGEFYGRGSASGNGVPGGDFVAKLTAFHNIVEPPKTIVGIPHPNDPIGHFANRHRTVVRHGSSPIVVHQAGLKIKTAVHSRSALLAALA